MRAHLIAARYLRRVTVHWDDEVDAIIAGDAAAGLASVTPARGVVVVPMAPLGLRDRDAGTVTVTSSLGLPKKLDRIRRNPSVALAYHAREHGDSDSPLYVLVQGAATVQERPNRAWLESITPQWEHFLGPRHGGTVGRLMDIYYWQRLAITVQVRRVIVYDGTAAPRVFGEDLPDDPPAAQRPPKLGTHPRVDTAKVAARGPPAATHAAGMGPHRRAADGGSGPFHGRQRAGPEPGHQRRTPAPGRPPGGSDRPRLPPAHGRPGTTRAHRLLEVDGSQATYAPHTKSGHALPRSQTLMTLGSVVGMRPGYRKARQLGLTP